MWFKGMRTIDDTRRPHEAGCTHIFRLRRARSAAACRRDDSTGVAMGRQRFFELAGKLFAAGRTSAREFEALVAEFLPNKKSEIHAWLWTNDYPEAFHLARIRGSGPKQGE
ncbi:MAG: hypothetical protein AB1714_19860 [Acidobacteriota bacterium]